MKLNKIKKIKNKKPLNTYDLFYKQQFRKDLIDKLNVSYVHEVDLHFNLKFRGYLRYNAFDRNPLNLKQAFVYQYIFESIFNQRIVFRFFQKKNIQRDQPADYFYKFKCNINKRKLFFAFLSSLHINLYHRKLHHCLKKPFLIPFFHQNQILIKNIKFYQACWIKKFLDVDLDKEFYSLIQIKTKPLIFLLLLSSYQMLSFVNIKIKDKPLNLTLPNYASTKYNIKSR